MGLTQAQHQLLLAVKRHTETLGYSPATIERHATASAATYAHYIVARR